AVVKRQVASKAHVIPCICISKINDLFHSTRKRSPDELQVTQPVDAAFLAVTDRAAKAHRLACG
ncbi:MAG: hypothetical protein IJT08_03515, partial [Alphaproteobacteria bacterium]|nr:hypothetical protein [Alphaproteobacteria bacterium]